MEEHNPVLIAKKGDCSVSKCMCGVYQINYQWITLHMNLENLIRIMEIAYNYESKKEWQESQEPLKIAYGPVFLLIDPNDFNDFYKILEDATSIEMNIDKLISCNNNE